MHYLRKTAIAADKASANRVRPFDQNNEKSTRKAIKSTSVGYAKVVCYTGIIKGEKKRDEKEEKKVKPTAQKIKCGRVAHVAGRKTKRRS